MATPILDLIGINITGDDSQYFNTLIVGRQNEVNEIINNLSKRNAANVVLTGEVGIGKTSTVVSFAHKITATLNLPLSLYGFKVYLIEYSKILTYAENIDNIANVILSASKECEDNNIILYFNGFWTLYFQTSDSTKSALRSILINKKIKCIISFTPNLFHKFKEEEPFLNQYFYQISIIEPTDQQIVEIVKANLSTIETYYKCSVSEKFIKEANELTNLYLPNDVQPLKTLNLIEDCASSSRLSSREIPHHIIDLEKEIEKYKELINQAVGNQEYEKAADLRDDEAKLIRQLEFAILQFEEDAKSQVSQLEVDSLYSIISQKTGLAIEVIKNKEQPLNKIKEKVEHQNLLVPEFERLQALSILHGNEINIEKGVGFVLIPHNDEFRQIFDNSIKPALEENGIVAYVG